MAEDAKDQREKSKRVGALRGLWPFIRPYRPMVITAALALVVTASVSLIMPMAVRRVIDGFGAGNVLLLDKYFGAALLIAALLALGTGVRYYFVTKLGERVVTDGQMRLKQGVRVRERAAAGEKQPQSTPVAEGARS